jgi:hypothetical protein
MRVAKKWWEALSPSGYLILSIKSMSKFARDDSDSDTEQEVVKVEAPVEEAPAEDTSCANPSVMTKYQEAAKVRLPYLALRRSVSQR